MPLKKTAALLLCIAASASALPSSQRRNLPGGTQVGKAALFSPGLGACGRVSSASELVAAVSASIFGAESPNNPVCGKKIKVSAGGKSVTAAVQDICIACSGANIDLSPAAFTKVANVGDGRIPVTWKAV